MSQRMSTRRGGERPPKKEKEVSHTRDFRFTIRPSMYPTMAKYQLRAAVILGSEVRRDARNQ